jgi:ABC-type nitrate/sulfonate/bicarbonate transport system substrate-binding protein
MKVVLILLLFILSIDTKVLDKVSLQLQWKHQFDFAGYYMAKEKDFYKDGALLVITN